MARSSAGASEHARLEAVLEIADAPPSEESNRQLLAALEDSEPEVWANAAYVIGARRAPIAGVVSVLRERLVGEGALPRLFGTFAPGAAGRRYHRSRTPRSRPRQMRDGLGRLSEPADIPTARTPRSHAVSSGVWCVRP
jgi:hypothetical protein